EQHGVADDGDIQEVLSKPGAVRLPNCPAPVRRVRVHVPSTTPKFLTRSNGAQAAVKPGNNHHIEIYSRRDEKGRERREVLVVPLFDAVRNIAGNPRQHPDYPEATFVMSLCKNDMVLL